MSKRARKPTKAKAKEEKENINYNDPMSVYENVCIEEYKMVFAEFRLKSFTSDWPFDEDSVCNPQTVCQFDYFGSLTQSLVG